MSTIADPSDLAFANRMGLGYLALLFMLVSVSQPARIALFYATFVFLLFVGTAFAFVGSDVFALSDAIARTRSIATMENEVGHDVQVVTRVGQLTEATSTGRCILFVNGNWDFESAAFHRPYSEFASWSKTNADHKTIMITLESGSENEMWYVIQTLWRENAIERGGLKNHGGAGRVVWFNDGRVVDYAWCVEVPDLDQLKARTEKAFR